MPESFLYDFFVCGCNNVDNGYHGRDPSEDDPINRVQQIYLNTLHIWHERNIQRVHEIWDLLV